MKRLVAAQRWLNGLSQKQWSGCVDFEGFDQCVWLDMLKTFLRLQRGTVQATSGVEDQSQGGVVIRERLGEPGEALGILQVKRPVRCIFRFASTERDR